MLQSLDMKQDVWAGRCAWRRAQPCERADFATVSEFQEGVQFKTLAVAQFCRESIKQLAFGTHDDFGAQPFQHRQLRDNDGSSPQLVNSRPNQDDAAIGLQGRRHQPRRK